MIDFWDLDLVKQILGFGVPGIIILVLLAVILRLDKRNQEKDAKIVSLLIANEEVVKTIMEKTTAALITNTNSNIALTELVRGLDKNIHNIAELIKIITATRLTREEKTRR